MTGLWITLCMTALTYGAWHARGLLLEHREQAVRFERRAAEHDKLAAQAIREQAEDMLIDAEYYAINYEAMSEPTQELPTIRVRVGRKLAEARDWARGTFGSDDHQGWDKNPDALREFRKSFQSRRNWPMRHRPTPLAMPQHLPPDPERALRVHTLARTA